MSGNDTHADMRVLVWWEEDPTQTRVVERNCRTCYQGDEGDDPDPDPDVVSPSGIAHYGIDSGMTVCGRDATGSLWWWKL